MKVKGELVTERLFLKEITEKDTDYIVRWREKPEVYRFFRSAHALTKDEHLKWFHETYLQDMKQISFMLTEIKSGKKIGVVGIKQVETDTVEVSYLLDESARGKGYASEAVCKVMFFSKDHWGCIWAIAEIHRENSASIKMIQKLGFQKNDSHGDFEIFKRDNSCISELI